jgi:peptide/nickel transport system substrate-binding protein
VPDQYLGGSVAESWEVTSDQLIFHIRQGVMWTGREGIMEKRELTAEDCVISMTNYWNSFRKGTANDFVSSFEATGRYTMVANLSSYNANWPYVVAYGSRANLYPPEVIEAGPDDWKNQVGTGPFILTSYVAASEARYVKNPDWWDKTTINGKVYNLPFVDKLVLPVIVDEATQIAALRTGKIDFKVDVPLLYQATLSQTCPDLIQFKYLQGQVRAVRFACDTSTIFSKTDVRRALMIGTDLKFIRDSVFIEGELHGFPVGPALPEYTPIEELPESTRELFTYDVTKAKKMLADAGYPIGFSMELVYDGNNITERDAADMLNAMWAKLGVTVKLIPLTGAALTNAVDGAQFKDAALGYGYSTTQPGVSMQWGVSTVRGVRYKDDYFTEQFALAFSTTDLAERTALTKELAIRLVDSAAYIAMPTPYILGCHWAWIKNYYDELDTGYLNFMPMVGRMWIDQELKSELGY